MKPGLWTKPSSVAHCVKLPSVMSSQHRSSFAKAWRHLLTASCLLAGCGTASPFDGPTWGGDGSFGTGAPGGGLDGGLADAGIAHESDAGADDGERVRVRLLHGLLNSGPLIVCHDPDLELDVPDTLTDESTDGPEPPRVLARLSGTFGSSGNYVALNPVHTGTLTFHRPPPSELAMDILNSDAGVDDAPDSGPLGEYPDGDVPRDGHGGGGSDGAGNGDGSDADDGSHDGADPADDGSGPDDGAGGAGDGSDGVADGMDDTDQGSGGGADAGVPMPPDPCAPETREAAMPVRFATSWLDPAAPPELPPGELANTLTGGSTVTLMASGLVLDEQVLAQRAEAARTAHLEKHPDDQAGADAAAYAARKKLEADVGALVVPALHGAPSEGTTLSFAHLVPDVMGTDGRPGALRLCIKAGDVEQPALPAAGKGGFPFRRRVAAWQVPEGTRRYTFRVFSAATFDAEGKECAGTSLAPLAELSVRSDKLEPNASYTLVALGAIAPEQLCGPSDERGLARTGCPVGLEELRMRLVLLRD